MDMKHSELVEAARRWLCRECPVVVTEMKTYAEETADALGWCGISSSHPETWLVECKTNLIDWKRDAEKPFRSRPEKGMGDKRFFLIPRGAFVVPQSDLTDKWGIIEWDGKRFHPVRGSHRFEANKQRETLVLLSALRRLGVTSNSVSVRVYTTETRNTATLSLGVEDENADCTKSRVESEDCPDQRRPEDGCGTPVGTESVEGAA